MTPEDVHQLDDDAIQQALSNNQVSVDRAVLHWRKHHPTWPIAAMAEQALVRQKAHRKLGSLADRGLLYQAVAYEQVLTLCLCHSTR